MTWLFFLFTPIVTPVVHVFHVGFNHIWIW
jgi:hypothetical protein